MADTLGALAEFNVQADSEGVDKKSYPYWYWRRADGWITIGPSWPVEYTRQREKGMEPLRKYGEFHLTTVDPNTGKATWRVSVDKYRMILENGGAHEFPVRQVQELGWCCKPPRGVTFPQLEGVEHVHVECSVCKKKLLSQHDLARHESIAHATVSQQQGYARALVDAMSKVREQGNNALADAIECLAKVQEQQGQLLAKLIEGTIKKAS